MVNGQLNFSQQESLVERKAQPGEFPWQVAIERRINHTQKFDEYCGGSILSQNTILTAAHCFHDGTLVFNTIYYIFNKYYLLCI